MTKFNDETRQSATLRKFFFAMALGFAVPFSVAHCLLFFGAHPVVASLSALGTGMGLWFGIALGYRDGKEESAE